MIETNELKILVALLDDGVAAWRPVRAKKIDAWTYLILHENEYDSGDEKWQFPPGTLVICELQKLENELCLIAVKKKD
jgi:hypothetical protein